MLSPKPCSTIINRREPLSRAGIRSVSSMPGLKRVSWSEGSLQERSAWAFSCSRAVERKADVARSGSPCYSLLFGGPLKRTEDHFDFGIAGSTPGFAPHESGVIID